MGFKTSVRTLDLTKLSTYKKFIITKKVSISNYDDHRDSFFFYDIIHNLLQYQFLALPLKCFNTSERVLVCGSGAGTLKPVPADSG